MSAELIAPRFRPAFWRGVFVGALLGLAAALWLDWYFTAGPMAASPDRGEAHGFLGLLLGFPVSLLGVYAGRGGIVMSAGIVWGLVGGTLGAVGALVLDRIRSAA